MNRTATILGRAALFAGLALPLAAGAAFAQNDPDAQPGADAERPPLTETLPGSTWLLTALGGEAVVGEATLTFGEDGESIGGRACNSYGGDLSFNDEGLPEIGAVFSTMMACEEPRLAEERALFDALEAMASVRLGTDTLVLLDAEGNELAAFSAHDDADAPAGAATMDEDEDGDDDDDPVSPDR